MALITFLSDYGWRDPYVAAIKAGILSQTPQQPIVDLSHEIGACDIAHGAYVLRSVFRDFPEGTVHMAAVDSSGPPNRPFVAAQIDGHFFIGPDNGLLSLLSEQPPVGVHRLPAPEEPTTFPEKVLFPKAALALVAGQDLSQVGIPYEEGLRRLIDRKAKANRQLILGAVIQVDHYGNLITNINQQDFDILSKNKSYTVKFGRERMPRVQHYFQESDPGDCFLVFNSLGLLQIGINQGNASELLGLNYDSPVSIEFHGGE